MNYFETKIRFIWKNYGLLESTNKATTNEATNGAPLIIQLITKFGDKRWKHLHPVLKM